MNLRYRLLGPVEVRLGDEQVSLAGPRARNLLAALLLDAGRVVPVDRLIDLLWEEAPPRTALTALQGVVSQLRRALRIDGGADAPIEFRPPGYAITVGPGELDLYEFERLVQAARRTMAAGEPARGSDQLHEALALWRGPALGGVTAAGLLRAEVPRLEELRLGALEDRIEADLTLGGHQSLVAELRSLVAAHPHRERLLRHLMLALYRCGRQADALDAFRQARRASVEELGLDPGRELERLERAILRRDPALDVPPGGRRPGNEPMTVVATISGITVQSNKETDRIYGTRVTFTDGSWCDVASGQIANRGDGHISLDSGPGEGLEESVTRGPEAFSASGVEIRDVAATVDVEPHADTFYEVTASGPRQDLEGISTQVEAGRLVVSGQQETRNHEPASRVAVKVPGNASIWVVGRCADVRIGDTDGALTVRVRGRGNLLAGRVGPCQVSVTGSGEVEVEETRGSLDICLTGSGHVEVTRGRVTDLRASVTGSGRARFAGRTETAALSLSGSGNIDVAHSKQRPSTSVTGSGRVHVRNWEERPIAGERRAR